MTFFVNGGVWRKGRGTIFTTKIKTRPVPEFNLMTSGISAKKK